MTTSDQVREALSDIADEAQSMHTTVSGAAAERMESALRLVLDEADRSETYGSVLLGKKALMRKLADALGLEEVEDDPPPKRRR